jgi:hypothetical protein
MQLVKKLAGSKTYLSPMGPEAAELWFRWHNDLETGLLAGSPGHRTPGGPSGVSADHHSIRRAEGSCVLDRRWRG